MIQVFGRKSCNATRAAERFFRERGIAFQSIDLDIKPPSPGELDSIARAAGGFDALCNKEGKAWQELGMAWKETEIREELLDHPQLLHTPLVRNGTQAAVGKNESAWKTFALEQKK